MLVLTFFPIFLAVKCILASGELKYYDRGEGWRRQRIINEHMAKPVHESRIGTRMHAMQRKRQVHGDERARHWQARYGGQAPQQEPLPQGRPRPAASAGDRAGVLGRARRHAPPNDNCISFTSFRHLKGLCGGSPCYVRKCTFTPTTTTSPTTTTRPAKAAAAAAASSSSSSGLPGWGLAMIFILLLLVLAAVLIMSLYFGKRWRRRRREHLAEPLIMLMDGSTGGRSTQSGGGSGDKFSKIKKDRGFMEADYFPSAPPLPHLPEPLTPVHNGNHNSGSSSSNIINDNGKIWMGHCKTSTPAVPKAFSLDSHLLLIDEDAPPYDLLTLTDGGGAGGGSGEGGGGEAAAAVNAAPPLEIVQDQPQQEQQQQ